MLSLSIKPVVMQIFELKEYNRAPRITRKRLYLEAMEDIIKSQEDLVIIDSEVKGMLPISQTNSTK